MFTFLRYRVFTFSVFLFCALFGLGLPHHARAVGVTPGKITVPNTANGVKIPKTIRVTRPTTEGSLSFQVEVNGPGARYIELPSTMLVIPAGANYGEYTFNIAPTSAPNGMQEAFLQFIGLQNSGGSTSSPQFSIATYEGATANIQFTINDTEIKDYTINNVAVVPVESNNPPMFTFEVNNKGNVDAQPEKVDVTITDQSGTTTLAETIPASAITVVPPGQQKNVTAALTKKLSPGSYFVDVTFYDKTNIVYDRKKLRLEVLPEGTLKQDGQIVDFKVDSDTFSPGSLVKIDATFKNIGEVGSKAVLYVKVLRDGQTLDTLRSDEQFVGLQQTGLYSVTFRPSLSGAYQLEGYFSYGVKETERRMLTISSASGEANAPFASFSGETLKKFFTACTPRFVPLLLLVVVIVLTILLIRYINLWRWHELCSCPIPCPCHLDRKNKTQLRSPLPGQSYGAHNMTIPPLPPLTTRTPRPPQTTPAPRYEPTTSTPEPFPSPTPSMPTPPPPVMRAPSFSPPSYSRPEPTASHNDDSFDDVLN